MLWISSGIIHFPSEISTALISSSKLSDQFPNYDVLEDPKVDELDEENGFFPKLLVVALQENTLEEPDFWKGLLELLLFDPEFDEENGLLLLYVFEKGFEFEDLKGLLQDWENGLFPLPEFEFEFEFLDANGLFLD